MNHLRDIDFDKTAHNVDKLLRKKLPSLALRCGSNLTELSSPKLSLAPSHTNRTDIQENMIVDSFGISKIVDAIHKTIFSCSDNSKIILVNYYLLNKTQEQVIMLLPYEKSQYYKALKPIALVEFADRYDYWQCQCNVDPEDITDLHVYI